MDLTTSVRAAEPPAGISLPLQTLWWDAKGDWAKAHECAQADPGPAGAAVHAYLHRKEPDPAKLMRRLGEIVCHDNFTEMHAFKHHQAIVEEYHATREPWRTMHLVCGAQAAAISFGKNMEIYEAALDLLHAA
jgi:hypothetical protein